MEFFGKEGTLFHENLYPNNVHLWNGKSTGRIDLVSWIDRFVWWHALSLGLRRLLFDGPID